ncbi:MAG: hypothetical protein INF93_18680 [Rhodobacter sp.]|nr:hypothetical protein [Rhodobacter sp.]
MLKVLVGHKNSVRSVAFSLDGRSVLTGSSDHAARLSDKETAEQLWRFDGHADNIRGVALSPDSRLIARASNDGTVRIWSNPVGTASAPQSVAPPAESVERRMGVPRSNVLAVVFGNKNYVHAPEVRFADRDATAMADWYRDVLGLLPENVPEVHDAISVRMAQPFGTEPVPESDIHNRASFADEVFVARQRQRAGCSVHAPMTFTFDTGISSCSLF